MLNINAQNQTLYYNICVAPLRRALAKLLAGRAVFVVKGHFLCYNLLRYESKEA